MDKISDALSALALLAVIGLIAVALSINARENFEGKAFAVDGDSLQMDGQRMRLQGIDAPEIGQECTKPSGAYDCGRKARNFLRQLISGREVSCKGGIKDKYERVLVLCSVGETDLNAQMVRAGWALSYGGYSREENQARNEKSGMWAGEFENPQLWRQMRRERIVDGGAAS